MRIESILAGAALCICVAGLSGCKKEEAAPPVSKTDQGTASSAEGIVESAKSAARDVSQQATAQVKAAQDQAQGLIERAKSYVSEQKYQDALGSLNQLSNTKLTAEQQKAVDDLKAQIQAAVAKLGSTNAASALSGALGGALGGKK